MGFSGVSLVDTGLNARPTSGMGVERSYTEAVPLLEQGCIRGHPSSCHNLAVLYYHGHGVEKDMNKFKQYNERAKIFSGKKNPFKDKKLMQQQGQGPTAH